MSAGHIAVLAAPIAELARDCRRVADCTVGAGGHAAAFLAAGAAVLAIDRDPAALVRARARHGNGAIDWCAGRFGDPAVHARLAAFRPDFVLFDLGVSSMQLDDDERGFSFRPGVPLDMRMTPGAGPSGATLLNTSDAGRLAALFRELADERRAARLARTIVARRGRRPFATSDDLVNAIRAALGPRTGPATFARLFQAVRIAVNAELDELRSALPASLDALEPGGRLAVIGYHSGEDRIVKDTFREWGRSCVCPPRQPVCRCRGRPLGDVVTRRPLVAGPAEVAANPRARSARLRVFRKADGP